MHRVVSQQVKNNAYIGVAVEGGSVQENVQGIPCSHSSPWCHTTAITARCHDGTRTSWYQAADADSSVVCHMVVLWTVYAPVLYINYATTSTMTWSAFRQKRHMPSIVTADSPVENFQLSCRETAVYGWFPPDFDKKYKIAFTFNTHVAHLACDHSESVLVSVWSLFVRWMF